MLNDGKTDAKRAVNIAKIDARLVKIIEEESETATTKKRAVNIVKISATRDANADKTGEATIIIAVILTAVIITTTDVFIAAGKN